MEDKILKKHRIHFIVVVNMNNKSEKYIKYKFYKCYVKYDRIFTLFYRDKQTGKKVF
jgi:type II secretory pathway predicted ATPase ExeA